MAEPYNQIMHRGTKLKITCEGSLKSFRNEFMNLDDSAKIDARDIKKHSNVLIKENILARMK